MNRFTDASEFCARMGRDARQPRVHRVVMRVLLNEALDDSVLERMEADRAEPPTRRKRFERTGKRRFDLRELIVDMNAQRLEGPRRGMLAGFAGRDRSGDDLG